MTLSWNEIATTLDFKEYVVQLSPNGVWDYSGNTEIFRGLGLTHLHTAASITPGVKTFLIKAVDTTGNYSVAAVSTTVTIAAPSWTLSGANTQTVTHIINDGQMTITWPTPASEQFVVESYQVKFRAGNSSSAWGGAAAAGRPPTRQTRQRSRQHPPRPPCPRPPCPRPCPRPRCDGPIGQPRRPR